MKFFRLKRYCHFFINNIFYFIVFVLGLFIGFLGKSAVNFLPEVLAVDLDPSSCEYGSRTCWALPTSNYSSFPAAVENSQLLERLDVVRQILEESAPEGYGYTIVVQPRYTSDKTSMHSSFQSEVSIYKYRISDYLTPDYEGSHSDLPKNHFTLYVSGWYDGTYRFFHGNSNESYYKYSYINFTSSHYFLTTPIEDLKEILLEKNPNNFYDFSFSAGPGGGSPYHYNTSSYVFDMILYYSSIDIQYHYQDDYPGPYLSFNGKVYDNGDIWPAYYSWKKENSSFLENLTYVCTDKPFFLTEKIGTETDYRVNSTFSSSIYLDYDLPMDLYPYIFQFFSYSRSYQYQEEITGHKYNSVTSALLGMAPPKIDLYEIPFTIDTSERNNYVFAGQSYLWEIPCEGDLLNNDVTSCEFGKLKKLDSWRPNIRDKYFYSYMKYLGASLDDVPLSTFIKLPSSMLNQYFKSTKWSTFNPIANETIDIDVVKADYLNYLLLEYQKQEFPAYMCFYYDSTNLTFSWATYNDDGSFTGPCIINGQLYRDCTIQSGLSVFGSGGSSNDDIFGIFRDSLSYLGNLVNIVWNSLPPFLQASLVSIFSLAIIFLVLRMVGYYG